MIHFIVALLLFILYDVS